MKSPTGKYRLYGKLTPKPENPSLIRDWLESQTFSDPFEKRDMEWFLEACVQKTGNEIELFDEGRGGKAVLEHREELVDWLLAFASSGSVMLEWKGAVTETLRWKVLAGGVRKDTVKDKTILRIPKSSTAFAQRAQAFHRQDQAMAARSPKELLEEHCLRSGRKSASMFFVAWPSDLLDLGVKMAHDFRPGNPGFLEAGDLVADLESHPETNTIYVQELAALTGPQQERLLQAIQDENRTALVATQYDPLFLLKGSKLKPALYHRLNTFIFDYRKFS